MTYAAVLAGPVATIKPSGSLTSKAKGSYPPGPDVSSKTSYRRMSCDTSGPLRSKPDATTTSAPVTNTCLPAETRPNKTPTEGECIRASSERSSNPWTFVSRESCNSDSAVATRTQLKTVLPPHTLLYR